MHTRRPPIPVVIIVVLVLIVAGYFLIRSLTEKDDPTLRASGSIQTVEVTVSPEMGGKVAEVLVSEGDHVKAGDVLLRMDDALLQAQRNASVASLNSARAAVETARATLANAQSQYDLAFSAARAEAGTARVAGWQAPAPAGYTLPGWFFTQAESIQSMQAEVDAAKLDRDNAQAHLKTLEQSTAAGGFIDAEALLNHTRAAVQVAEAVLTKSKAARDNADLQLAAQKRFDSAQAELDDAQAAYDDLIDSDMAGNIITARAELAMAEERYQTAQDRLLALQYGDQSPRLTAAQAALHLAEIASDQAALAVPQAEAALALIDAQIAKLTVKAPSDGVVLTRSVEPGEVFPAGAAAFSLGRLDDLTITVYIPEDRYGEVKLGQSASVTVDPFPGETFTATVIHIADEAEFTPRNVQTVSGRKSTVFAIKLRVDDPQGKLKPGMPADVAFK
jgi:HlyD family secretion protein